MSVQKDKINLKKNHEIGSYDKINKHINTITKDDISKIFNEYNNDLHENKINYNQYEKNDRIRRFRMKNQTDKNINNNNSFNMNINNNSYLNYKTN